LLCRCVDQFSLAALTGATDHRGVDAALSLLSIASVAAHAIWLDVALGLVYGVAIGSALSDLRDRFQD